MNANPEFAFFARLVESLTPWLDQMVIIGGWAHRLHRLHPSAQPLQYEPLATLDADVALPRRIKVTGDEIYKRLHLRRRRARCASIYRHGVSGWSNVKRKVENRPLKTDELLELSIQIADAVDAAT